MKLYESVVIACDKSPKLFQDATALWAALEAFGLRVHLYDLAQKRGALAFLAGDTPPRDYVVLFCHGGRGADGGPQLGLTVVDQQDGDYDNPRGWQRVTVGLTPTTIPDLVNGMGRTLVCLGCGAGEEPFAQAFLQAGLRAYIAPEGNQINANAAMLFAIGFSCHRTTEARIEDSLTRHTDREAAALAAALDADYPRGTRAFRYFPQE